MAAGALAVGRARRAGLLVVGFGVVTAVTAACGSDSRSPGVASVGGKSATTTTIKPDPVAYARCMREHGVTDFPDPDTSGNFKYAIPGDGDNSAVFNAAQEVCKAYMSQSPTEGLDRQNRQQHQEADLNYSRCMRRHGVPNFPDPKPGGGIEIPIGGGGGVDPDSPAFQQANEACKHLTPGGRGFTKTPVTGRDDT